jgi:hypothetical protein
MHCPTTSIDAPFEKRGAENWGKAGDMIEYLQLSSNMNTSNKERK